MVVKRNTLKSFETKSASSKGSITVFLSMILLILISVITVSLESAHLAAVKSQIYMGSDAAVNNLFSRYNRYLFEEYGLLALDERQDITGLLKTEMEVFGKTGTQQGTGWNHLQFHTEDINNSRITYLMDENGEPFLQQLEQIITADRIAEVKKTLTSFTKKLSQSGVLTEQMNQVMKQEAVLEDISENLSRTAELNIQTQGQIDSLQKQLKDCYDKVAEKTVKEQGDNLYVNPYLKAQLSSIRNEKINLEKKLQEILNELNRYKNSCQEVNEDLESVKEKLQDETFDEDYRGILHDALKGVLSMTAKDGENYEQILNVEKLVKENLSELQKIQLPQENKVANGKIQGDSMKQQLEIALKQLEMVQNVEFPVEHGESVASDESSGKSTCKLLIDQVQKLLTEGAFTLFIGEEQELSDRVAEDKDLPSKSLQTADVKPDEKGEQQIFSGLISDISDALSLNFYLTEYLQCYEKEQNNHYDLEYVLGNSSSDVENLKSVLNRLVLMRQAMNLVYLLQDTGKRQQAEAAATAILAITGNPILIQGLALVILTAWAYAEAVSDVRILLDGGNVGFIKTAQSWAVSLEQAADWQKWLDAEQKQSEEGMDYAEYLRILLFFQAKNKNLYRGADMIQWNICQKDAGFQISQCICSLEIEFALQIRSVFLSGGKGFLPKIQGYPVKYIKRMDYS